MEIVPVLVVEIVPALVVEMIPLFAKAGVYSTDSKIPAQTRDFRFFIVLAPATKVWCCCVLF